MSFIRVESVRRLEKDFDGFSFESLSKLFDKSATLYSGQTVEDLEEEIRHLQPEPLCSDFLEEWERKLHAARKKFVDSRVQDPGEREKWYGEIAKQAPFQPLG